MEEYNKALDWSEMKQELLEMSDYTPYTKKEIETFSPERIMNEWMKLPPIF